MIRYLKTLIPDRHPIRLYFHKLKAIIACLIYGFPSKQLHVIGVTGTKGKTTTCNLIANVLMEAGYKVGMTTTVNFRVGDRTWVNHAKMTTLSPFFLQKTLREMVNIGCQFAVLEVSSHAMVQNRVWGVNFDTVLFTNIGEDHLDYHGGFTEYLRAKGMLFSGLNHFARKPHIQKVMVLNQDDSNFAFFDQYNADKKYTFGLKSGTCYANEIEYLQTGVKFTLNMPNQKAQINLKMPGQFSVYNAVAAATVGLVNAVKIDVIKAALEKGTTVAGRFEQIDAGQDFAVVVDYAHTTESLGKLVELYKSHTQGRLITVFGATGGGRDKAKRPKMGTAADAFSDLLIVTDDDPCEEDRLEIIEQISEGIKREEGVNFWKMPTRYEAIRLALSVAQKGDTVVIAGKGAETSQVLAYGKIKWDDRQVVREILAKPLTVEL